MLPPLSEKRNACLRPLKKKGFPKKIVTKDGVYDLAHPRPWNPTRASGKTRKGHRSLRAILTQLAHAAVCTKGTYLSALYQRLAARRGKQRAIIASILTNGGGPMWIG